MKRMKKLFLLLCGIILAAALTVAVSAANKGECIPYAYLYVDEPTVGQQLDFNLEVDGSTAYFEIDEGYSKDDFYKGVRWRDCTDGKYIGAGDYTQTVKAGHTYQLDVRVKSKKNDYYFWISTLTGEFVSDFYINDSRNCFVETIGDSHYSFQKAVVSKTFTARQKVDGIEVMVMNEPTAGQKPTLSAVSNKNWHRIEQVVWKDVTTGTVIDVWHLEEHPDYTFIAGHEYAVSFWVVPDYGYEFENPEKPTPLVVNREYSTSTTSITCTPYTPDYGSASGFIVTKNFGVCLDVVKEVALTVTAPKESQKVLWDVKAPANAKFDIEETRWYVTNSEGNKTQLNSRVSNWFQAGYTYELEVDVCAKADYKFPLNSSTLPDVQASINGNEARVAKIYDQDPSERFKVCFSFGKCSDTVLDVVTIENVQVPVAGRRPSYRALVMGQGYRVDTAVNQSDRWGHFVDGISWYDMTDQRIVYDNDTFVAGHQYTVQIDLEAINGYTFNYDQQERLYLSATVNGQDAEPISTYEGVYKAAVIYTFVCEKEAISNVILWDLDAPQVGKLPDTAVTAAYPELYRVESVRWLDADNLPMNSGTTFAGGQAYRVEIQVQPTDDAAFTQGLTATLDGAVIQAEEIGTGFNPDDYHRDGVYCDGRSAWIYYTFRGAPAAPEAPSDPVTASWNGDTCTVCLTEPQYNNTIAMAAVYQNGKLVKVVPLMRNKAEDLTGDQIKVFFVNDDTYAPLQQEISKRKP